MRMKRRFLLALDRFDTSEKVVRYFGAVVQPDNCEVVLLHVGLPVPDSFFDVEPAPESHIGELPVAAWQDQEKAAADTFLEGAKRQLIEQGFMESAITVKHALRQKGIARDILSESRAGYSALLIGRSETHDMYDTSLGSVTSKLVDLCTHLPVGIVASSGPADCILVGLDRSAGAFRCIDFVADVIANPGMDVLLCHVIRNLKVKHVRSQPKTPYDDLFSPEHLLKWQLMHKEGIRPVLDSGMRRLTSAGWPAYKVHTKVVLDVERRSQCLVDELRAGKFGAIVVGRRGASIVKEFFMGRVGRKVLNMASEHTVWIVN